MPHIFLTMSLHVVEGPFEKDLLRIRQQLLDGAKDPMIVIRGEGIALCNEAARALLRWPSVDMTGVQVRALFSSSSLSLLRGGWDDAHRASTPVQVRGVTLVRHDGEEEYADIILFPLAWSEDPTTLVHLRLVTEADASITDLKTSEIQFRSFIENISDGVFQSSPEGKLLLVNPALIRMLGYDTLEEVLKLNIGSDIYVDAQERADLLKDLQSGGVKENVELRLKKKDGSTIVCLTNTRAVRRSSGEVLFYEGTLKDVTAWKQVQEELRSSQERYKAFIKQSTEGVWCFELHEPIPVGLPAGEQIQLLMNHSYLKECNERMAHMLGYQRPEEILGAGMGDLFVMEKDSGLAVLEEYVANGYRLENRETFIPGPEGSPGVHVSSNAIGIVEDGYLIRAWGTQTDITARKEAELQLRESQRMETLGTLAGGVAHDFNNILTVIQGYLDLLEREKLVHEDGKRSLSAINTAVKRGAGVVRQLMTFAREEQGTVSIVKVAKLLSEIKELLQVTLTEDMELVVSVPEDTPDLRGDEAQLHQALMNLLLNSRDAMPAGGTIVVTAKAVEGSTVKQKFPDATADLYVCISVSDEGAGIPDGAVTRVFDPFFTTKDIGKGSGLGLAVVYGVARGHEGFVDVKPNEDRGTIFHVYIPGFEPSPEVVADEEDGTSIERGSETVLVVEDEQMLLDLLKVLLEGDGYTVLTASDGVEAVKIYTEHKDDIAIVISDMGLPMLGGYEVFQKMKEINPNVKSILASGYMDPSMRTKLLDAGAMEFLQKPYVPNIILANVRKFINGK